MAVPTGDRTGEAGLLGWRLFRQVRRHWRLGCALLVLLGVIATLIGAAGGFAPAEAAGVRRIAPGDTVRLRDIELTLIEGVSIRDDDPAAPGLADAVGPYKALVVPAKVVNHGLVAHDNLGYCIEMPAIGSRGSTNFQDNTLLASWPQARAYEVLRAAGKPVVVKEASVNPGVPTELLLLWRVPADFRIPDRLEIRFKDVARHKDVRCTEDGAVAELPVLRSDG